MYKIYEVVIYTASLSIYADPLLDEIDPSNYASYRLFREHCTFHNNAFVKDLSVLGRDLKDVIIVDNSPASYAFQPENAMPILTWMDDMTDTKLAELSPVLELLVFADDVRDCLKDIVSGDSIDYIEAAETLRQRLRPKPSRPMVNTWTTGAPLKDYNKETRKASVQPKGKKKLETVGKNLDRFVVAGPLTPQYKSKWAETHTK